MKKLLLLLILALLAFGLTGCVGTTGYGSGSSGNGFYLTYTDGSGKQITTGASMENPADADKLKEMYSKLPEILKANSGTVESGKTIDDFLIPMP